MTVPLPLTYGAEVAAARAAGRPVVALESTIITHGMPFPANLETAREVEGAVREAGATPATIAVLDGRLHVLCFALKHDALRVISFRKANKREANRYGKPQTLD